VTDRNSALARRSRLPANPADHKTRIARWFLARHDPKYDGGQARHGGELAIKPRALFELENEHLDAISYGVTLREQLVTARRLVDDGLRCEDVEALADARDILDAILEVPA